MRTRAYEDGVAENTQSREHEHDIAQASELKIGVGGWNGAMGMGVVGVVGQGRAREVEVER